MYGIILAGGSGSRLAPLSAQLGSKALVTFAQRPQIINQILWLKKQGCTQVIVVANKQSLAPIATVVNQLSALMPLTMFVEQQDARGPVDAIRVGMLLALDESKPVIVIASDTWVDGENIDVYENKVTVGTHPANNSRSWCYYDDTRKTFVDGVSPKEVCDATILLYRFPTASGLNESLSHIDDKLLSQEPGEELGMSWLMNAFPRDQIHLQRFKSWLDLGDVRALAEAKSAHFISRSHHSFQMDSQGRLSKSGVGKEELAFMQQIKDGLNTSYAALFPQVYDVSQPKSEYVMEHVDLPTLAELWLYWPGLDSTWKMIIEDLITRCKPLWELSRPAEKYEVAGFYAEKAIERYSTYKGRALSTKLTHKIWYAADYLDRGDAWVNGHGDLNFTNILYSMSSNLFKLIDPRGGAVPRSYEFAKLWYSPTFSAITHDLFEIELSGKVNLFVDKDERAKAMQEMLCKYYTRTQYKAAEALMMLAATPLHNHKQAKAFETLGLKKLQEVC